MLKFWSWRYGLALGALVALYLLPFPFSLMNFDLARDIAIAFSIARGETWPMQGPAFAGAIHAGPIWYYLFALPFVFAPSVLPAILWIGAIAALKIPLAYLIGARFVDRPTGLLWALLLIFPGWETFESVTVLHPSLVATCTLGFLWFVLLYARDGRPVHLAAAGFALALAFHAHPSTVGLTLLLFVAVVYRHSRAKQPWRLYGGLAIGVIAPFLPYFFFQVYAGFPDWYGATGYLMDEHNLGRLRNLPKVFVGLFATGPATVADGFAAGIGGMTWVVICGYGLVYAAAASGLAASLARGGSRRTAIVAMAAAFFVLLVIVTVIRADTPYHMTYVLWVFASGLLALGLRVWFGTRGLRQGAMLAVAFASVWTAFLQGSVASSLDMGTYRFALLPLFDIKQPMTHGTPMPFVPAYALRASGDRFCSAPSVVAHGALAVHLLHDYAIEARLVCGDVSHISLGGTGADADWVGVSRSVAGAMKLPIKVWLGPVGVTSAVQVLQPLAQVHVPSLRQYPPATDLNERALPDAMDFDAAGDEIVLVTNMYFTFSPEAMVEATANGVQVPVTARDQVSSAYFCAVCARDARVHWHLDIAASALDRIDVVTVADRNN